MTQEDFDKTRWSPYDSYRMKTDQFQVIFINTCNCIPKITKIIKSKVRMVSLYGEVRFVDMYAMAYITRIKKTFLPDARRSSNFIKRMEKLTKAMDKYLNEAKKKVLTLTVSKEWFDMIVSGEKTEEYREIKPYWASRLVNQKAESGEVLFDEFGGYCRVIGKLEYKPYTHLLFINGYRKDSPRIEKEIKSIAIGKPKKGLCPDKWLDKEFFVIKFE